MPFKYNVMPNCKKSCRINGQLLVFKNIYCRCNWNVIVFVKQTTLSSNILFVVTTVIVGTIVLSQLTRRNRNLPSLIIAVNVLLG